MPFAGTATGKKMSNKWKLPSRTRHTSQRSDTEKHGRLDYVRLVFELVGIVLVVATIIITLTNNSENGRDMSAAISQMANMVGEMNGQQMAMSNQVDATRTLAEKTALIAEAAEKQSRASQAATAALAEQAKQLSNSVNIARNSLRFQQRGMIELGLEALDNFEVGKKPLTALRIKNVGSVSLLIGTFFVIELGPVDAPITTWKRMKIAQNWQEVNLQINEVRYRPIMGEYLSEAQAQAIRDGRASLRITAVARYVDATNERKLTYLCREWFGSLESQAIRICASPNND